MKLAEERMTRLMECLVKAGRTDDFLKAVSDESYRRELYREFRIVTEE